MHQLGWSQAGFFDSKEDEIALHHCVARYHAYVWNQRGTVLHTTYTLHKVPGSYSFNANGLLRSDLGYRHRVAVSDFAHNSPVQTNAFCSTHQLLPQKYSDDCVKYIGRFVNQLVVSSLLRYC